MVGDPRRPLDFQTTCHLADTEPCISTLVANRGVLGRRIWSLVASLALVSWLDSWTCSWWGACVRAVVLVCFHVLAEAGIRACVGGRVCVHFGCVCGRIRGGRREYGVDGINRKRGGLAVDMNPLCPCEDTEREWVVAYLVSLPPSLLSLTWGEARGDDGGGDWERGICDK